MPKKQPSRKIPYDGASIAIYGIFHFPTLKLIAVDLDENNMWFEFDLGQYNPAEYAVVKLNVSF